jgi:N-acyl-D-aspartate/D-glutamate deacylase
MPEFDLIIHGGLIVDGSGGHPFEGDVGITGSTITGLGRLTGSAKRSIEARGRIVTPGFVDIHTHYDGQVTWENSLEPSPAHGVTTAVMSRVVQLARGFDATVVSGEVIREHDQSTGARPGRLIRGGRNKCLSVENW